MKPTIRLQLKAATLRGLTLKYAVGFDMRHANGQCLRGHYSEGIHSPDGAGLGAGEVFAQVLEEHPWKLAYLFGRSYQGRLHDTHLALRPEPGSAVVFEDRNVRVMASGMARILYRPAPECVCGIVPRRYVLEPRWNIAWNEFPEGRIDPKLVPLVEPGQPRPTAGAGSGDLFPEDGTLSEDGDYKF